jgi:Retrotransposon gag protein
MATAGQLATILQGLQGFVPSDATAAGQYNTLLMNLQAQANAQFVQPPTPPTPLHKKLGSLDKFNGNSKEDVDAWIQHMELFMNLSQVPNAERLEYGTYFLRGHTMKWYQSLATKPISWTQFRNQIKAQFQLVNPISTACDDLDKLHQTTSICEYISKFLKISQLITDSTPGELTHGFI